MRELENFGDSRCRTDNNETDTHVNRNATMKTKPKCSQRRDGNIEAKLRMGLKANVSKQYYYYYLAYLLLSIKRQFNVHF